MNPVASPVLPEFPASTSPVPYNGSGSAAPSGATSQAGQQPFSSVLAYAQNGGQKLPTSQAPTTGKHPLDHTSLEGQEESSSGQVAGVVSGLSVSNGQEPSIVNLTQPDFLAVSNLSTQPVERKSSLLSIEVQGVVGETTPDQLQAVDPTENSLASIGVRSQQSEFSVTTSVNDIEAGYKGDTDLLTPRQPAGPITQRLNESPPPNAQLLNKGISSIGPARGTTVSARIGEPVLSLSNAPSAASAEVLSLEGFTRQTPQILSSYVSMGHTTQGVPANGMGKGTGDGMAKLNARMESDAALKTALESSAVHADDTGTEEFGLDQESSQRENLSLPQPRGSHVSAVGGTRLFSDVLGEGHVSELGGSSRSGMIGERPVGLPSSLPQRLQMDVTLADDSRIQIDVAVQQRQVSAHLVTDQAMLRNLAVQNEGQLLGQLAHAGLELRNFDAHLSDHSATGHQPTDEDSKGVHSDTWGGEDFQERHIQESLAGVSSERGLHLVA